MARGKVHILDDDGSPIQIGDSSTIPPQSPLRKLVGGKPHISITHRCFRKLGLGLGIQNSNCKAKQIQLSDGTSYDLVVPWSLDLNHEVVLASVDNKTISIQAGDFDLTGVYMNGKSVVTLLIGNKNLSFGFFISPKNGIVKITFGPASGLALIFDCPK